MRSTLVLTAVIATVSVVTAGTLALFTDAGEGSRRSPVGARPSDRFTVCVDAIELSSETQTRAKLAVEDALEEVVLHPVWQDTQYSSSPPEVQEGCPRGPAVYERQWNPNGTLFDVLGRKVDTPSYFKLHLFVLPQDEIERINGSSQWRETSEEAQCGGDNCGQITTGLYIADDEIDDHNFLVAQLDAAIGLSESLILE